MNKNKIRKLFAVAVISGAVMTGLNNTAYAVITDYAIKVNDQVYAYNQTQLEDSFLEYKSGKSAKLYEDFRDKLVKGKGFHAIKDDKKGFIPYETVEKGFLKSKNDKKTFNINKFIETDTCESVEVKSIKKVSVDEKGSVLVKDNENKPKETNNSERSTTTSGTSSSSSGGNSSSSSSSRGSSSRGGSSSKRNKEESKKVVPQAKKEEPKKVVPEVQPVPEVKKEEKKPEIKENINKDVIPAVNPQKGDGSSTAQRFEDNIKEDIPRVVEKSMKQKDIVSNTKGNISIKSETSQTAQKGYSAQKQITTILVEGEGKENGTIEILGQKIEIKKGDTYGTVTDKIYRKFQGDKVWDVRYRYGQWGTMGNITFHAREFADNVDIVVNKSNENGLTYKIKNEAFGKLAISDQKEVCTATVLNNSTADEKIKVKVYSDIVRKDFAIVEVEIKNGETKEKIAEKIANKLKEDKGITTYFKVENKGSQVYLTQKEAYTINLSVKVVEKEVQKNDDAKNKIQGVVNKDNLENKDDKKEKKPEVPVVKPEVKKEEKTESDKKVQVEKQKEEPKVQPAKENVNKEVIPAVNPQKGDVPSTAQRFEDSIKEDIPRVVEKPVKQKDIISEVKGNISIKSETSQIAQKGESAQKQITTILVEGQAKENGTIEILGQKIEIKKGDTYGTVIDKIYRKFQGDKVWDVRHRYGQWGRMGNITFHAREFGENVNIGVQKSGENGLTYKIKNEAFGKLAIAARKEVCTATVLNDGIVDKKIKVKVHSDIIRKTFTTVEVEIKKGETKEKIAEKIANKLKEEKEITKYFKVENKGAQFNLTQNEPYTINLSVTVE